jgi:membrane-associated phospholipid phosphatase
MDTVIAFLANYLLYLIAVAAGTIWVLREDRAGKLELAATGVLGLALTFVLITVAAHLHTDPRPFVSNPALHPLISHSADNGFPSDHCAVAALVAACVWLRHRVAGAVLAGATVVLGAARVAAHVHHVQDVVAGVVIGTLAAGLASYVVRRAISAHSVRTT